MAKEFFVSAKYQMSIPESVTGVGGGLILPSGVAHHTLSRRNLERKYPHLARRLLDPQLYLAGLNASRCRKACANLASYGWFGMNSLSSFDTSQQTQAQWRAQAQSSVAESWIGAPPTASTDIEETIRLSVDTQVAIGCEALLLPSPLTTNPATNYSAELQWLDSGLDIASRAAPNVARIVTVAISDTCLRGMRPGDNGLIDAIVDQVTSRAPEGAYLVLEEANEDGYYCTHPNTVGAVLRIIHGLKLGGIRRVVVSFAGTAGLLALAVGADTWSTGWYRGERRLRLVDFEQQEGRAVPAYYSHNLAGEFHLESDLDRATRAGFLSRIADVTVASEGLVRALERGASTSAVPDWQYRQSNVAASIEHFLIVMSRETGVLSALNDNACLDYAQRWLENADNLASALYSVGSFNSRTSLNHQRSWREAFAQFLATR